jgi:outer membrane lipoprotein-sorting protein
MLKKAAVFVLAGVLMPLTAPAQEMTLDQLLDSYYEAIGGLEAWKAVESMKISGTMSMGRGMQPSFTRWVKRPDKIRVEFEIQGNTVVQAYDGQTGWRIMPMRGSGEPEAIEDRQARGLRQDADIDGVLVGWEEAGHQLELEGLAETEGTTAYKLKVTLAGGDVVYYYLDADYFVPIRIEGSREIQGNIMEFATTLSDYKEVDGLLIAHSVQASGGSGRGQGRGGGGRTVTFTTVELNVEIDDALFSMPAGGG